MTSMKLWTRPLNYAGAAWNGWFVGVSRTRDSDSLDESNFMTFLEEVRKASTCDKLFPVNGPFPASNPEDIPSVYVVRESHWMCGWVEWIAININDSGAAQRGHELMRKLDAYPVLDEDDYSDRESDSIHDYWASCTISERVEYCQEAGESVFAARARCAPETVFDHLRDQGGF